MARESNPNRKLAFEIYKSDTSLTPKQIAEQLSEKVENIRSWKCKDKWDEKLGLKRNKRGAPKRNKNSIGNKGGGAPKGNLNSMKHGMCCDETKRLPNDFIKKWFPVGLKNAYEESANLGISKLDKIGYAIDILWSKILVSQKITSIKNKKDTTKELKKQSWGKTSSEEFEIQFAWDKENNSLDVNSRAMERLTNMIDKYERLLNINWDLATEEQKLRINKLKGEVEKLNGNGDDGPIKIEFVKASDKRE
ncbi:hypothetical protein JW813_11290 [Clostridium botulinum]|uniref:phage terminase small subunit n=1 Tax=Clostridium botulinum TaxID=1491 RepID=UPI0022464DE7|nr:phage terminase small subunit [Clostridium botulinum]UZP02303.1 hypothetical protein JW813_11290 [Clostridium botulinum]UZP05662.1 hypothetical protein JYA71_11560 [Clostridium botulinum]UZP09042.1 hypothetical protein JYA74_11285 [Clostridium botulinum]